MSSVPAKDIIYIDVDDEITVIIDKVRNSPSKIVALVLPKRATTLQSIVNMKLLKKSAGTDKKHLVLITAEAGLLPLAAATELYVAKNLQSKPEIPDAMAAPSMSTDIDEDDAVALDDEPAIDASKPVGDLAKRAPGLAGAAASTAALASSGEEADDMIDMADGSAASESDPSTLGKAIGGAGKAKKDKNRKVPNFNKFRLWLILGGCGLVVLIALYIVCFKVLPSAKVLVKTDSQAVQTTVNLTLNPSATTVNTVSNVVPAQSQKIQKTLTQQADATGQQNNGTKASGTITMSAGACSATQPADVPAGSGATANGLTFITQTAASFNSVTAHGKCTWQSSQTIPVTSQNAGAQYNIAASSFAIAGRSDVSASSSDAMTGGTDNITKIVQQSDIDGAKAKLEAQDMSSVKTQLQTQLSSAGYTAIAATFTPGTPAVTTSANAGDAANNVTVTEVTTYTMMGVKQTDLQTIVAASIKSQIDPSKQNILDYGLASANYGAPTQSGANTEVNLETSVVVGPDLKTSDIVKQIAGQKTGDATKIIKSTPGVTDVTITYSPFWVSSIPHNQSKITVTIDKPQNTKK